jgi:D-erythronate 2-dehydrogenase
MLHLRYMNVLVIGAAGMVGRKFCEELAKRSSIGDKPVDRLTMADTITPIAPVGAPFAVRTLSADISDATVAESLVADRPDIIYHLAAIVSGEAEADFDKGYQVNLNGTRRLFEAVRQGGYRPRIVFTSSIAVFGAPFPEIIPEDFAPRPLTETAHRELMNSWARMGETARAVRHYRELVELLREQVGVPPAAETTALYRRLMGEQ